MNNTTLYLGDNVNILKSLADETFHLVYVDPPFNSGKQQKRRRINKGIVNNKLSKLQYNDKFDNFTKWLEPRIVETKRLLTPNGSFFIHMDYREIHYIKILCDKVFGRENFINEIIWTYDFGARATKKYSAKHDTILWYAKNKKDYIFNFANIDRVPYKAPELIRNTSKNAEEKIKKGKAITDSWTDINIVHTLSKEKTSYPTQKPLKLLERIVKIHSDKNDNLLDYFCGSGTFGEAAIKHNRNVTLIDENPEAINITKRRLENYANCNIYEKF